MYEYQLPLNQTIKGDGARYLCMQLKMSLIILGEMVGKGMVCLVHSSCNVFKKVCD